MMSPTIYLAIHENGPGFYFFNETWTDVIGPYETEEEAQEALNNYMSQLNTPKESNFWEEQFEESKKGEVINPMPDERQIEAAWNLETNERKPRIKLESVDDFHKLEGLIDGGYLSFIYGSRKNAFGGWDIAKYQYANYLLVLDSGGIRQDEYPLYKSRRNERRDQYDYMRETYERVKRFRKILRNDPMVNTVRLDGYEADDVIALLFLKGIGKTRVVAQDKDFFMVDGLKEAMTDHTGIPQAYRDLKLPKYAIPPRRPATWALTQAIFGDKSDSIPRLLPSRVGYREMYAQLIRTAPDLITAFWNCYAEWGDQFITNLRLVLLPHPTLAEEDYDIPSLLFEDLVSGKYWSPNNYTDGLLEEIFNSLSDMDW